MNRTAPYVRHGRILALEASAYGAFFDIFDLLGRAPKPPFEINGDAAVVSINGPLTQHADSCWDSYDAILDRVKAAVTSPAKTIVLRINSPGGNAQGCMEAADELRALCAAAQKPLLVYADGQCCSAAMALACAAEAIYTSTTGILGSIGVITPLVDATGQDRMQGLSIRMLASGARKLDGNVHDATTPAAIKSTQARVDEIADIFCAFVANARHSLTADTIRSYEAATFLGEKAVQAGLATEVLSWAQLMARLSTAPVASTATTETPPMDKKEMRAFLAELAEGDGKDAEKAKAALKCLDEEEAPKDDKEAPAKEDKAEDAPPPKEEDKKDDASAKALAALARDFKALKAQVVAKAEAEERTSLMARALHVPEDTRKSLAALSLPVLREVVSTLASLPGHPAAALQPGVTGARGETQGSAQPPIANSDADFIARKMGLSAVQGGVINRGSELVLGPMSSEQASKRLAEINKGAA